MKRSNFNATGRTATAVQKKLPARKETATVTAMKTVWAPCTVRLTTVLGLVLMTQMIAVQVNRLKKVESAEHCI